LFVCFSRLLVVKGFALYCYFIVGLLGLFYDFILSTDQLFFFY